jgi:5-methylthioadenosine/S-adenosylhomocysteine deaminase
MDAATALRTATLGGARAIGLEDRIGSIEVGKRADLVAVDFGCVQLAPVYSPLSHLVYAASRRDVSDVWVDGRARVRDRVLLDVDTERLIGNAARWAVQAKAALRARGSMS